MGKYWAYYKTVLRHKYLFFKHGAKFGVGLLDRISHNLDMLRISIAKQMAVCLYDDNGNLRFDADTGSEVFNEYKTTHPYYVDYWRLHHWRVIPDRWMRVFVTDRYIESECDLNKMILANRDLFFYQDSNTIPRYSTQVSDIVRQYSSQRSQFNS
ncbi:MAG: hypothetical protein NC548_40655 [Lachnospiraceae bacterium]|nr:hypothetical protein [Lachnospiraceae bacterium]